MVDNRPPDHGFIRYTSAVAQRYADRHGYDFRYQIVPPLADDPSVGCLSPRGRPRHVAWAKLLAMHQLLSEGYDSVCYVDTDVMFMDLDRTITEFVAATPLAWGSRNGDVLFLNNKPYGTLALNDMPCSGVILLTAGPFAAAFLRAWYALDVPGHDLGHPWEQNALWEIFRNYPRDLGVFDAWMFADEEGQWLRHVPHDQDRETRFAQAFRRHAGSTVGVRAANVSTLDVRQACAAMRAVRSRPTLLDLGMRSRWIRRGLYVWATLRSRGLVASLKQRLPPSRLGRDVPGAAFVRPAGDGTVSRPGRGVRHEP